MIVVLGSLVVNSVIDQGPIVVMQLSESQIGQVDGILKNPLQLGRSYTSFVKKPSPLLSGLNYPQIMEVTQNS